MYCSSSFDKTATVKLDWKKFSLSSSNFAKLLCMYANVRQYVVGGRRIDVLSDARIQSTRDLDPRSFSYPSMNCNFIAGNSYSYAKYSPQVVSIASVGACGICGLFLVCLGGVWVWVLNFLLVVFHTKSRKLNDSVADSRDAWTNILNDSIICKKQT